MENGFQLEKKDIDNLFDWVGHKNVKYKDVQYEIVDHLASGMEDLMIEDSTMSKTKALYKVYENFPITGFAKLIEEKEKGLRKFWLKRFFKYILDYLKLPKIIILILIFSVCFNFLLRVINYEITGWQLYFVAFVFLGIFSIRLKSLETDFKNDDKFLVIKSYFGACRYSMFGPYILAFVAIVGQNDSFQLDGWLGILFCLFISVWLVVLYANLFVFPKMLVKEIQSKYSHLSQEMFVEYKMIRQ